jgi:proprotein convertase subtilisin/kexin type 5
MSCPTGTYPSPVTYSCDNCNLAGCIKCVLSPIFTLTCTQCQAGYYLYNSSCLSSCPNDTILSGSECVPKPVCTKYQWNGFCLDECPSSTFSTSTSTVINGVTVLSLSCRNCSIYCQQCSSEMNCAACISGTFLILRNGSSNSSYQCVNQCPTGFYQTSRSCVTCPSPCANCRLTDSGVICLSCLPGFLQMGSLCVSSCPTGYFASSGSCSLCSAICYSCIGSASNCTLCKNTNNFIPSCNTSAINCTLNQYLSSASNCANCHNTCVTCFGGSNS